MSVAILNNSIAKHDFLNIQMPVQDEMNEQQRSHHAADEGNMRHCETLTI